MKTLLSTAALGLLAVACTSRDTVDLETPTATTTIGVTGGVAISTDGNFRVEFPAGALAADTAITIKQDKRATTTGQSGPTYRVGPEGVVPGAAATLTIAVPSARPSDTIYIADVGGASPTMVSGTVYEASSQTVHAPIAKLTSYAVIVQVTRGSCDQADSSIGFENKRITPCWITEVEPNDSTAGAMPTDLGLDEAIDVGADIDATDDYYGFVVPPGQTGAIFGVVHSIIGNYGSCPQGLIVGGELLDANGNVLSDGENEYPCVAFNHYTDPAVRDLPPGQYYVRLFRGAGGQDLPYRFVMFLLGPGSGTVIIGPDTGY